VRAATPPASARFGFATYDVPPLDRVAGDLFGEKAAAVRLRRAPEETARAAVDWLAHARSPFFLWVELDALAIEAAESPEGLATAAEQRLHAVDIAVGALLRELARAGRDRRTIVVLTADHGEAFGEEGWYGHRRALPCVARVPLWIADPEVAGGAAGSLRSSRDFAPWVTRRLGLTSEPDVAPPVSTPANATVREPDLALGAAPAPFVVERGEVPRTDDAARTLLPALRPLVASGPPEHVEAAELYVAALLALKPRSADEEAELVAARKRWLDAILARPPRTPLLPAFFARSDLNPDATAERRLEIARAGVAAAPWYFPAVRALAATQMMRMDAAGSIATLEQFGRDAPLSPAARAEFEKKLEENRRAALPSKGGRPK
jgi:hypothetical protein